MSYTDDMGYYCDGPEDELEEYRFIEFDLRNSYTSFEILNDRIKEILKQNSDYEYHDLKVTPNVIGENDSHGLYTSQSYILILKLIKNETRTTGLQP